MTEESSCKIVRGWVTYADFGLSIGLTAHSVIQDANGKFFDITPRGNDDARAGMWFVSHLGSEQELQSMKESNIFIQCLPNSPLVIPCQTRVQPLLLRPLE